jgi:hypothetical protein
VVSSLLHSLVTASIALDGRTACVVQMGIVESMLRFREGHLQGLRDH